MQRDLLRLVELLEAADHLGRALDGVDFERFTNDAELRDSTLWRLMKVGEASVQLSEEVRGRHPEIEWHRAIGFRNRIVHGYFDLDLEVVYRTATDSVPILANQVRLLIREEFPSFPNDLPTSQGEP